MVVGAVAESNGHCPGEIAALLDGDLDIETDADGIEVPEHFGIGIGDPGNAAPLTVGEVAELAGRGSRHRTVGGGNGITVRVTFGEAQFGVHPRDHQIGNGVFEDFGLVVDFVPAVSEFLNQIGLDQPVAPDHGDGGGAAAVGQGDGSVAGVIDQALVREFADRLGHRRGRDAHFLGQELGGNPLVGPLLDSPDDLEVVLGHRRECERVDCRVVRRSAVAVRRR